MSTKLVIVVGPTDVCSANVLTIHNFAEGDNTAFNQSKYFGSIVLALVRQEQVIVPDVEKYMSKRGALTLIETVGYALKKMNINFNVEVILSSNKGINTKIIDSLNAFAKKSNLFSYIVCNDYAIDWSTEPINAKKLTCVTTSGWDVQFTINGVNYKRHITFQYGAAISEMPVLPSHHSPLLGDLVSIELDGNAAGFIIDLPTISAPGVNPQHITVDTKIKAKLSGSVLQKLHNGVDSYRLQEIDSESKLNPMVLAKRTGISIPVTIIGAYAYAITY